MQRNRGKQWNVRLEISSRKLETPREHFMQRWDNKGTETVWTTEAEDIKKPWPEYTEQLYKKDFQDPDNHNGVILCQTS